MSQRREEGHAAQERVVYTGDYDTFGLCECGYFERLPFGMLAHVHKSVYPDCGGYTGAWKRVVGRPARGGGGFLRPGRRVLIPKLIACAVNEYEPLRTIEKAIRPEVPGRPLSQDAENAISAAIILLDAMRGRERDGD